VLHASAGNKLNFFEGSEETFPSFLLVQSDGKPDTRRERKKLLRGFYVFQASDLFAEMQNAKRKIN
jgi:hypothetical protein